MTTTQSAPEAPAIRVRPNPNYPGSYSVQVYCPYCSGVHIHNWSGLGAEVGHRRPICWIAAARKINGAGYTVTIPDDMKVEVQQ